MISLLIISFETSHLYLWWGGGIIKDTFQYLEYPGVPIILKYYQYPDLVIYIYLLIASIIQTQLINRSHDSGKQL